MNKNNLFKTLSLLLVGLLTSCSGVKNCEMIYYADGRVKESDKQTIVFDKEDKLQFQVLSDNATDLVSNYVVGCGSAHNVDAKDVYYPNSLKISWTNENKPNYSVFNLADNRGFNNSLDYMTFGNSVELKSLFIGTQYYYRVSAFYDDYTLISKIYTFSTDYTVRTIEVEGVSNTRDVGGAYTVDGKHRIKQGVIYRGANVNSITEAGKDYLRNELGVISDFDLREPNSVSLLKGVSPIGEDVNLISFGEGSKGCPYYIGENGINSSDPIYRNALLGYLKEFAKPSNYPIYFHCAIGRDRTGTISFLLQALCGVSEERLSMEYEFSYLSVAGNGDGTPSKTMMNNVFAPFVNYLSNYKDYTASLSYNVEQFMLDLGVSANEIASIRSILLEEVK